MWQAKTEGTVSNLYRSTADVVDAMRKSADVQALLLQNQAMSLQNERRSAELQVLKCLAAGHAVSIVLPCGIRRARTWVLHP